MSWLKFLTPVKSVNTDEARKMLREEPDMAILDVRQPKEYEDGHIPAAHLIPMAVLGDMLDELDPEKPLLVYCAIGGRSRMAAQFLAGKGFKKIYNLSGGFKAWNGWKGYGEYETGLELFEVDDVEQALMTAYSMESALEHFYSDMAEKTTNPEAADTFKRLSGFEVGHREAVARQIRELNPNADIESCGVDRMEGGLDIDEYMKHLGVDLNAPADILSLAMAVEMQAYDLYSRASVDAEEEVKIFLQNMAKEEQRHVDQLGKLMENIL